MVVTKQPAGKEGLDEEYNQIIGGAQILMGISYDIQDCFEEYLTDTHHTFLAMLRVLEEHLPKIERTSNRKGRRPYENTPIFRSFLATAYFQIKTNSELRNQLVIDSLLRKICGFGKIPSLATFSRRLKDFSEHHLLEQTLYKMVRQYHSSMLVGHVIRDSTAISAREKPVNKKKDVVKQNISGDALEKEKSDRRKKASNTTAVYEKR